MKKSSISIPKTIAITGASSGIGAALAEYYATKNVTLFLSGRNKERLNKVAMACKNKGAKGRVDVVDVTNKEQIANWLTMIDEKHPLDLVIANAGISGGSGGVTRGEPVDQARKIFDVNLTGVLNTVEPILPRMIERKKGQIAIMSSLASFSGWPGAPAYSGSKAAVRVYGEALRGNVQRFGVKVNVVCPGFIKTPMTDVNNYKMPFLMEVDEAARIIAQGLAQDKDRIAFPLPTYLVSGLLGMLPPVLSKLILSKVPHKPVNENL